MRISGLESGRDADVSVRVRRDVPVLVATTVTGDEAVAVVG